MILYFGSDIILKIDPKFILSRGKFHFGGEK